MKRQVIVAYVILAILLLNACRQTGDITTAVPSSAEDTETISTTDKEDSWRDHYEVRDTATVVAELKEHFAENREELEQIALAMLRDTKNTEEYPYGLYGSWGKLYTRDSSMNVDFSNPLESKTADLIAAYYAKGFSEAQHIYIDDNLYYVRQDVCVFSYDAFLEDDGVLTEVNLLYCEDEKLEEEKPFGFPPVQIISLDDHWSLCVLDYPY